MNTSITSSVTDGQKKQIKRFVEDAVDRVLADNVLDKDGAQKLIGNGDELQARVITAIRELSVPNEFADEEVASSYGYLSGYKPKGITEQTNVLRQLFPGIGYANEALAQQPIPEGAEGWFAIPRWQKVAKTYPEAVQIVLNLIKKTRGKFYNYRDGQIDQQHLRQSSKTAKMFQALGEQQKDNDILVVPCQFGKRHAGRSVRRAREVMLTSEFGLDAFSIGIMLLTHPERLQQLNDLWIDCAGDEFSGGGGSSFGLAPCFGFCVGGVEFGASGVGSAGGRYGSSSAFGPQ